MTVQPLNVKTCLRKEVPTKKSISLTGSCFLRQSEGPPFTTNERETEKGNGDGEEKGCEEERGEKALRASEKRADS